MPHRFALVKLTLWSRQIGLLVHAFWFDGSAELDFATGYDAVKSLIGQLEYGVLYNNGKGLAGKGVLRPKFVCRFAPQLTTLSMR